MREEFGKLLNYTVDENIVNIAYEKNTYYHKIYIIYFYVINIRIWRDL